MKWKKILPDIIVFFGSLLVEVLLVVSVNVLPEELLEKVPMVLFYIVAIVPIYFIWVSGKQMRYKMTVGAGTTTLDLDVQGMYHDIAKPSPEFVEKDQQVPVHETILDKFCTENLVSQPTVNFTLVFRPEADKCTFLLSNGYSCTAEAGMISENNYHIQWHTLSWNEPLEGRLSKEDKKIVALAFSRIDKNTIVWPFTNKKVNIMQTRSTYY